MFNIICLSKILYNFGGLTMNANPDKKSSVRQVDPIDDYLECVTFCSVSSRAEENDCQTICMERHLKASYF